MHLRGLVEQSRRPGLLARWSRGRAGRAGLILVGFHLAPVVVCALLWLVSMSPALEDRTWVPALLGSVFAIVAVGWLMLIFGFWGVGLNSGQDGGDQFEDFTPGAAIGLGWLRWFVQIVMIGLCFVLVVMMWAGVRWWHLASSPEIDAVPAKAESVPVPQDWKETDTVDRHPEMGEHHGSHTREFDVPAGYTYADVTEWFEAASWEDSFGALQEAECSTDIEQCTADVVARDGEEMTYSIEVWYQESSIGDLPPSVRVNLEYRVP